MDIPINQTRISTFEWWPLSIYVALLSMNHGKSSLPSSSPLPFIFYFTSSGYLLLYKLSHLWATSPAHSQHSHLSHLCIKRPQPNPMVIILETRCLSETIRVPLAETVFKTWFSSVICILISWPLCSHLKKAMLTFWKDIKIIISSKQAPSIYPNLHPLHSSWLLWPLSQKSTGSS